MRNKNMKNELTSNNCLKINRFKRYSRNNSLIEYHYNKNFKKVKQMNIANCRFATFSQTFHFYPYADISHKKFIPCSTRFLTANNLSNA